MVLTNLTMDLTSSSVALQINIFIVYKMDGISKKTKGLFVGAVILLLLQMFGLGYWIGKTTSEPLEPSVVTKVDTITVFGQSPVEVTKTNTRYVPVTTRDTVITESISIVEKHDTTYLILDTTQKHYKDSLYEAWVSGVDPVLDSVRVYRTTITRTVIQPNHNKLSINAGTVYNYCVPDNKHNVGFHAGLKLATTTGLTFTGGYHINTNSNHGPFVGMSYDIPLIP